MMWKELRFKGMSITLERMTFGKGRIAFYEQFGASYTPTSEPVWYEEYNRAERMFNAMVTALSRANVEHEVKIHE